MPEIKLGTTLLFLIPGLFAYCALFGIFASKSQLTVAPAPPPANSIKTIAIILVASIVVHGLTAILIAANGWICASGSCLVALSHDRDDFYRLVVRLVRSGAS